MRRNSDYASRHDVAVAKAGDLGTADHDSDGATHARGTHHGFSARDPSS